MSNVIAQLQSATKPVKKSEQLKAQIEQSRAKIKELEAEAGALYRELSAYVPGKSSKFVSKDAVRAKIRSVEEGIKALQNGIDNMQTHLRLLIISENAHDVMIAKQEAEDRERAAADQAAHEAAVKAAAVAEWLKVPGQTQASFETAWPQIGVRSGYV